MPKKDQKQPKEAKILAGNVYKYIKMKGYSSVREFCESNQLSNRTIGTLVRAEGNPSLSTIISISKALGVGIPKLFRD